jgi:perosamine synthetase
MIPVCEPLLTDADTQAVMDCLRTGWISSAGKYLDRFEKEWAAYCGMEHGIAVSNGTAALYVAAALLDLRPGDEVIMPAFTIVSCAQAVTALGAVPVLVDSDPRNWQMDVSQIAARITPRTKAIMAVHIYGHPADMDAVTALAKKHGLAVIEDAAETHGAEYKGRKCGGLADVSTFSFYSNKLITTGEGGMVLTRDAALAEKARSLRNLCFQKSRRFLHEEIGNNFRLTNVQAAMAVGQIARIEEIVNRKRSIAAVYTHNLAGLAGLSLPVEESWARSVYWVYGILLEESTGMDAAAMAAKLAKAGIETRPFFLGMHEQPAFRKLGLFANDRHPVAERMARQGLYLPSGLTLTPQQMETVCAAVRAALA